MPSAEKDEVLTKLREGKIDILISTQVIEVEGHTDDVKIYGWLSRYFPSNWELSSGRALAVLHYLIDELIVVNTNKLF